MRKICVLFGVALVACVGSVAAQTGSAHPGYYPIEEMGIFGEGEMEVNVDLSGAMLQVAAGAMENQDESLVELFSNLDRVRVQVGSPKKVDVASVGAVISQARARLESAGWAKILAVEEDNEQVYLYSLEQGGNIAGLMVLVNDEGDEVVLVNIAGSIDPRTLGRMLSSIEDFDLEELMGAIEQ
jgi:hypothetical protein